MSVANISKDRSAVSAPVAPSKFSEIAKRGCDLVMAVALLPLFLPVIAILYVVTVLGGGAGFFGHQRVGRGGETFRCWKIRTMVPDAEKVLETYLAENPEAAAEWARDFKLADDPRITRLGRILRKTSLDELPQIWNVLTGEMSFVGPRPVTRTELGKYHGYEWCYLAARPGVTGLWQVSGRNGIDYSERVKLDMEYLSRQSVLGDLAIMLRTVKVMLKRTGC